MKAKKTLPPKVLEAQKRIEKELLSYIKGENKKGNGWNNRNLMSIPQYNALHRLENNGTVIYRKRKYGSKSYMVRGYWIKSLISPIK
jgi:hypothetical protein